MILPNPSTMNPLNPDLKPYPVHLNRAALMLLALLSSLHVASADDNWPRFRGVAGRAVAASNPSLPTTWSKTENVAWAVDIPGWGWGSPIVWGDKVFVSTVVSEGEARQPSKGLYLGEGVREPSQGTHRWLVLCFDLRTGEQLWRREAHVGQPKVPRHPKSTYAAETPTTDGERLYVLFGDLGLFCYSLDGEPLWEQRIEPKKTFMDYGAAASPVVHNGQVFVVYDNQEESWIAAFDAKTGEQRWRQIRDEERSWATPLVWQNELRTEIVVPGLNRNRSYSLDGELLWEFDGQMSSLVIPSPFEAHGMVYLSSGYVGDRNRPTFAIKPGGEGEIAADGEFTDSPHIAWYQPQASPYNTSQIVVDDYLYTVYDQGFLTCHDAKTGHEVFGKQRFPQGASFTASPWSYNGKLFCLSEDGDTYVVRVGADFELLETNSLDELCMACPAIADGKLLIRTASKIYCLTQHDEETASGSRFGDAASIVNRAVESGAAAGAAHLVVQNGEVVHMHTAGVRDIETREPLEEDSIVRIYSMTKPITSVAAMTLFEQGKFQLDDPVAKFIPAFQEATVWDNKNQVAITPKRPITVRDVFRHTTGYAYGGDGNAELEKRYRESGLMYRPPAGMLPPDMTIEEAADRLAKIPAHHHPGERFTYGFSTDLLGRLVEVWSGKPLDQYLEEAILKPLEMHDTAFQVPPAAKERFASCHTKTDGRLAILDKSISSEFGSGFKFLSGGGGLVSTLSDYGKFCEMLVGDGRRGSARILKPETVQLMFTDQLNGVSGGFKFGLGFAIDDLVIGDGENRRQVKQYSWGGYASTDFRLVPQLNLFQVFIRQHIPSEHDLANQAFRSVYSAPQLIAP
jgi:CubicO group peptidase (beta-lactamase class C family)